MDEPLWRVSPYDSQAHGFRGLGAVTSEALCEHSVPTVRLRDEQGLHAPRCVVCLLVFGHDLADASGDPGGWARD